MTTETYDVDQRIRIPWGYWDQNGVWYSNPILEMTFEEQRESNIKDGYPC